MNVSTSGINEINKDNTNYVKTAFGGSSTLPRFDTPSTTVRESVREFLKSVTSPENPKIALGNSNATSVIVSTNSTEITPVGDKASGSFRSRGTASPY